MIFQIVLLLYSLIRSFIFYSFIIIHFVIEITDSERNDDSDMPHKIMDGMLNNKNSDDKDRVPARINVTESENIGLNLVQMSMYHDEDKPSKKPSLGEFVLPLKRASSAHKTEEKRKKSKKERAKEVPSLADIKLLHTRRKEISLKMKPNETKVQIDDETKANNHNEYGSSTNSGLKQSGTKHSEVGSLGDDLHGHFTDLRSQVGDIGNLGASNTGDEAAKSEETAWKRKFGDLGSLTEQPKNPEVPSIGDIGELNIFKKEMAAALKGLGPEATFMMKKSNVPKPHKRYWGINANDNDNYDRAPSKRKYWGINVLNKEKDSIPGKPLSYIFEIFSEL